MSVLCTSPLPPADWLPTYLDSSSWPISWQAHANDYVLRMHIRLHTTSLGTTLGELVMATVLSNVVSLTPPLANLDAIVADITADPLSNMTAAYFTGVKFAYVYAADWVTRAITSVELTPRDPGVLGFATPEANRVKGDDVSSFTCAGGYYITGIRLDVNPPPGPQDVFRSLAVQCSALDVVGNIQLAA